jgi:predicted esterase
VRAHAPWPVAMAAFATTLSGAGCPAQTPEPPRSNGVGSTPAAPLPSPSQSAPPAERPSQPTPAPSAASWPKTPQSVATDWCIAELSGLDEETCYALPDQRTDKLLIYLHGIVPPEQTSPIKTNFQTVVRNAARRASVAALVPRGKLGLAPAGHAGWWGWPTTEPTYRQHAAELIARFVEERRRLESETGARFSRLYLAGSSSGAYFISLLALHGQMPADGFGAMSGGGGRATPELARVSPKPFYIGYGHRDSVARSARALGELLRGAGWPVCVREHGFGHGAKEVYLDEAFAFWSGIDCATKTATRPQNQEHAAQQ